MRGQRRWRRRHRSTRPNNILRYGPDTGRSAVLLFLLIVALSTLYASLPGAAQSIMTSTEKLKSAFAQSLGLDGSTDFDHLAYGSTTGWDSVAHMALVAGIENTFDIMLSTEDVIDMSSFPKAKQIVAKYGIAFDA